MTQRVSFGVLVAMVLSACGSMPGADGGTGGGAFGGGSGGGNNAGGGGGGNTRTCQSRCESHFSPCGFPNPTAGCTNICARVTEAQLTCIEAQTCADDPSTCTNSNTGGGTGGGSGGGAGGGGGSNACAVPSSALKVTLPHFSSRGVALSAGSNCSTGSGYNWVWNSMAFVDVTTSAQAAIHASGSLYAIEYRFEQRALTPNDRSAISTETGIPAAAMDGGDFMSRTSLAPAVSGGLPSDVMIVVQVTSNAPPSIQFVSSSSTVLGTLKARIDGTGVGVNVELSTTNGIRRTAEFELKGSRLKINTLRL